MDEPDDLQLNEMAYEAVDALFEFPDDFGLRVHEIGDANVLDCGIEVPGTVSAGIFLVNACLGGRGEAHVLSHRLGAWPCSKVQVTTDRPYIACLMSQYAGMRLSLGKYFAMTSGPIRVLVRDEPLFDQFAYEEETDVGVGIMETRQLPTDEVVEYLCERAEIDCRELYLLVAPTASLVGSLQVVARSVETCIHKLHTLEFDVKKVCSAVGSAFLPPIPKDDFTAIARTNDSILYGGEVEMWVHCKDEEITAIGPKLPACASPDYGKSFGEIFARYNRNFYDIDPMLFSPALIAIHNVSTGSSFLYGKTDYGLVEHSFYGS